MKKGYHKMPDGTIMKDSDHMKKYKHGGSASHGNKKAHMKSKPKGNSGLYGRVQRKQGGGMMEEIGMAPPPGPMGTGTAGGPSAPQRGAGDPETLSSAQRGLLRQAQQYAQETGQTPDEVKRLTGIYGDQTGDKGPKEYIPVPSVPMPPGRGTAGGPSAPGGRMMAGTLGGGPGGLGSAGPGGELRRRTALQRGPGRRPPMTGGRMPRPPMGGRMPEPRLPGGGRLRPPVMGPTPDAGRMGPRRMESIGQSIRDALGMMSDKMGSGTRTRPPRPRSGMPRRGGGRRGGR